MDPISERLRARHPQRIDLSLDRMRILCAALGDPQDRLPPVVHVAGTNGKGSTVAFMRAMLLETDCLGYLPSVTLEPAHWSRSRSVAARARPPPRIARDAGA